MSFPERESLNRRIFIGVIILAVIGVTGFLVTQKPVYKEIDIFIPIESETSSGDITITAPRPTGLDVRLRGPAKAIAELSQKPLRYQLAIAEANHGVQKIDVDASKIELPVDVSIVHIQPLTIMARIERLVEKTLPVEIVLSGSPASSFAVGNTVIQPGLVQIKGPESVVSALTRIRMKPLDISGISKPLRQRVFLDLPDGIKPAKPEQFMAEVTVEEKIVVKQIDNVVIQGHGGSKPYQISPPMIEMTVKGPSRAVNNLKANPDFDVYVDLEGLAPGVYVRRAVITLPINTTLIKATPELFTVHIDSPNENEG
jgi:YbbR domain-containing protein